MYMSLLLSDNTNSTDFPSSRNCVVRVSLFLGANPPTGLDVDSLNLFLKYRRKWYDAPAYKDLPLLFQGSKLLLSVQEIEFSKMKSLQGNFSVENGAGR